MTTIHQDPDGTTTSALDGAETDVLVIGAGFSGLCTAIRLTQEGMGDFLVLERTDDVGGTWHINTYPGCGCDVPSDLYSFSFAPNPDWTRTYSRQPEIGAYLKRTADAFGVRERIRTGVTALGASWDDAAQRWEVETDQGTLRARVLVSAAGPLFEPKLPEVPGGETFQGPAFHSARWRHDVELAGKRVATIGTGASAIQFVPQIAPEVERLTVFQRTAPWVMPHPGRATSKLRRAMFRRVPALQKLFRAGIYAGRESFVLGFVKYPRIMKLAERIALRHMREHIADPELRAKVTPGYTIGCKRILPSNDWYPALARPNVDVVTDGIREIRERSIVTGAGEEIPVDVIVYGTGFQVTDMPIARMVRGRDGRTLDEVWEGSPKALNGTTIAGFPNLFLLLGPNTGLGHSSIVYMIESQVEYVIGALEHMRARGAAAAEPAPQAVEAFAAEMDAKLDGTVWSSGCASWYADRQGRLSTLWPDWTFAFRRRLARFDPDHYELHPPVPAREREAVLA